MFTFLHVSCVPATIGSFDVQSKSRIGIFEMLSFVFFTLVEMKHSEEGFLYFSQKSLMFEKSSNSIGLFSLIELYSSNSPSNL